MYWSLSSYQSLKWYEKTQYKNIFGVDAMIDIVLIINIVLHSNCRGLGGDDFFTAPKYRRYASSLELSDSLSTGKDGIFFT